MSRPVYGWRQATLITLWDGRQAIGRWVNGMPAFFFRWVPEGLATRRQLRDMGLCPGGQEPYALLVWRSDKRWAWLYRVDLARPKRVPSPAQLEALEKAMAARRWCRMCRRDVGYCVSKKHGVCGDCAMVLEVGAA